MGGTNASTPLKCSCGSRDLNLVETCEWSSLFEVRGGRLDRDKGWHQPDCYVRLDAICQQCGRNWRPKKIGGRRSAIQITCVTVDDEAEPTA